MLGWWCTSASAEVILEDGHCWSVFKSSLFRYTGIVKERILSQERGWVKEQGGLKAGRRKAGRAAKSVPLCSCNVGLTQYMTAMGYLFAFYAERGNFEAVFAWIEAGPDIVFLESR